MVSLSALAELKNPTTTFASCTSHITCPRVGEALTSGLPETEGFSTSHRVTVASAIILRMVLAPLPWLSDRPSIDELIRRPAWQQDALCRDAGLALFFVAQGGSTKQAKAMCARCPVRFDCATYAPETGSSGIWAGKGPRHVGVIVSSGAA